VRAEVTSVEAVEATRAPVTSVEAVRAEVTSVEAVEATRAAVTSV